MKNEAFQRPPIVCIAQPAWSTGNYVKSTVKLMSELAKWHKVLYVDYPFTWKDVWQGIRKPGSKPVGDILGFQSRLRREEMAHGQSIHVLTLPPFVPVTWIQKPQRYDRINYMNSRRALPVIRSAMQQLDIQAPLVVNAFNPTLGINLIDQLGEQKRIYYCYDEIKATKWAGKHGGRLEDLYLPRVDALITSSVPLRREKSRLQSHAYTVKNGVDFEHFNQAIEMKKRGNTARPFTFGYVGAIDDRIDYHLLASLAKTLPHTQLLLVGPEKAEADIRRLQAYPNVILTGPKSPHELPALLAQMDVGLIPFVSNRFTANIYPMKVNEYLAAGLAVISTQFGDMSDFYEIIYLHEEAEPFIQTAFMLQQGIPEPLVQRGIQFAEQNAWTHRAHQFSDILMEVVDGQRIQDRM
ncbi:MAG: glycosyltransferase [Bacteroidota bacterium]